jgi:hypothetical protein
MTPRSPQLPRRPKDRFEVYRLFNGLAEEGKEGIDQGRTRTPLVKTFLIEHVSSRYGAQTKNPHDIWSRLNGTPERIDDDFFSIQGVVKTEENKPTEKTVGFLERYDERFFAYYTTEDSQGARNRVTKWIQKSPDLDSCWFNSDLLQVLWDKDVSKRGDHRYGKLSFKHESIFEMPEDASEDAWAIEEDSGEPENEEKPDQERRKARFDMSDRIGKINESLTNLQKHYLPLYALHSLRFPSRLGRGSHDLYQHGQITNRSESFEDHRSTALYLHSVYKSVLERTEDKAWSDSQTKLTNGQAVSYKGVPLIVRFEEPLNKATFDRWISRAFHKKNTFRLWGNPIRMGPTKVHIYGADRHLWQPLNLEITESGMIAILPKGTCGNTFHRLVTNIQRYVCPKVTAWVGSTPLNELMISATLGDTNEA